MCDDVDCVRCRMAPQFPDISDLLQAKERRRRALAALPWEEKVQIVEQMKQLMPKDAWRDPKHQAPRKSVK